MFDAILENENQMTTKDIADRLVASCRKGDFDKAQTELFSNDAVSIESESSPDFAMETKGLKAIREKGAKWNSMVKELKSVSVSEPILSPHAFACTMKMNVTMKDRGPTDMTELCVYEVKDGKIVSEHFYS